MSGLNPGFRSRETIQGSDDIESMDQGALHYWDWNSRYAFTQGGITGATGLPGLVANIPALYTIVFRMLQQMALCYGYDPARPEEKAFLFNILQVGSAADVQAKQAALVYLRRIQVELVRKTWKKLAEERALITMLREFAKSLGISLTKRKALQMVPSLGGIVGASFDGTYASDVGHAAFMCFRQRKLQEFGL